MGCCPLGAAGMLTLLGDPDCALFLAAPHILVVRSSFLGHSFTMQQVAPLSHDCRICLQLAEHNRACFVNHAHETSEPVEPVDS
jgi:hypothetical protein